MAANALKKTVLHGDKKTSGIFRETTVVILRVYVNAVLPQS